MKNYISIVIAALFLIQCNEKGFPRQFFKEINGYPDFKKEKGLPVFGLDSLIIDSLSTTIGKKNYWYMNTSLNALMNLNGYLRCHNKIVYIKVGDRGKAKTAKEQIFLDFNYDTSKSYRINYERDFGFYTLVLNAENRFYDNKIKDTTIFFRFYREVKDVSFTKEFLLKVSLRKGFVSFIYLNKASKKLYFIDFLPQKKVRFENIQGEVYLDE